MRNRFLNLPKALNKFLKTAALNMQEHSVLKNYKKYLYLFCKRTINFIQ